MVKIKVHILALALMEVFMSACTHVDPILNTGTDKKGVLSTKTKDLTREELPLALEINDRLRATLATKGKVAAGLAAPQIGIGRSVFIYSFDRTPENLTLVINPTLTPASDVVIDGWEACYSGMHDNGERHIAKMRRFEKIHVTYMDEHWNKIEKTLDGFAAKVFQHEYDHLQGYVNVCKKDALDVRVFPSVEAFESFMTQVRAEDAKHYNKG